jgi:hypothetical protein
MSTTSPCYVIFIIASSRSEGGRASSLTDCLIGLRQSGWIQARRPNFTFGCEPKRRRAASRDPIRRPNTSRPNTSRPNTSRPDTSTRYLATRYVATRYLATDATPAEVAHKRVVGTTRLPGFLPPRSSSHQVIRSSGHPVIQRFPAQGIPVRKLGDVLATTHPDSRNTLIAAHLCSDRKPAGRNAGSSGDGLPRPPGPTAAPIEVEQRATPAYRLTGPAVRAACAWRSTRTGLAHPRANHAPESCGPPSERRSPRTGAPDRPACPRCPHPARQCP